MVVIVIVSQLLGSERALGGTARGTWSGEGAGGVWTICFGSEVEGQVRNWYSRSTRDGERSAVSLLRRKADRAMLLLKH